MRFTPNQQIKRQLLRHILDGQFEPSRTLPTIESLAKTFKVSTKTVQKAIHALSAEGVIEAKRGTGLFIKPIDPKAGAGRRIGLLHPNAPAYLLGEVYPKPIIDGFEEEMRRAGYHVVPCALAKMDPLVLEESILKLRLSGLALFEVDSDILIAEFRELRLPMISMDYDAYRHGISSVFVDNVYGSFMATRHLIDAGHRQIAFMRPLMRNAINNGSLDAVEEERIKGYRVAMQEAGLPVVITEFGKTPEAAQQAMEAMLARRPPPTALISSSDGHARRLAEVAQKFGLHVPQDVSVMGFGNDRTEFAPGRVVSSVRVEWKEMGRQGAELLIEALKGPPPGVQRRILPVRLALHDSVAPPPKVNVARRLRAGQLA